MECAVHSVAKGALGHLVSTQMLRMLITFANFIVAVAVYSDDVTVGVCRYSGKCYTTHNNNRNNTTSQSRKHELIR